MSRWAPNWHWWLFGYIAICMFVDLFPHHGPPNFRYNGAESDIHVWNFGWPLASSIYDSRSGFHAGPLFEFVVLVQLSCLGIGAAVIAAARKTRGSSVHRMSAQRQ